MIPLLAILLAFSDLLCLRANAQGSGGALSGTVTNGAQVAIPNARVALRNVATGVACSVATDAAGFYTCANLAPGTYEMTVDAAGFTTQVRTNIEVTVGATLTVNVATQTGDPKDTKREALPLIPDNRASSTVSGNVSAATVRDSRRW